MIVVTGGAGFIGSNLVRGLNQQGHTDILVVDDLTDGDKFLNLIGAQISDYMHKDQFRQLILDDKLAGIEAVLHQGACSDTTERDGHYMMDNNYRVTLELFHYCQAKRIPFLYASSAAVYGAGPVYAEHISNEAPLNVYGYSKYLFDQVLRKALPELTAPVVGLRYFNVYGPQEQHKGRMASVALHNMRQYLAEGYVRLFAGWDGYADGGQMRDFIFVDDVVKVNLYFLGQTSQSGVFNCGTGRAQPFNDIAQTVVNTIREHQGEEVLPLSQLVQREYLQYIEFPEDLKGRYQSHTQADLTQLRQAGYTAELMDVQTGVAEYVRRMLRAKSIGG